MRLSRDEAREVALTAILLAVGFRFLAGMLRGIDNQLDGGNVRTVLSQGTASINTATGVLVLGAGLLIVLSPRGSIGSNLQRVTGATAAAVMVLGAVAVLNAVIPAPGGLLDRLPFSVQNGATAAVLGAATWWILRNFDPER